jgi:hypothetical protein
MAPWTVEQLAKAKICFTSIGALAFKATKTLDFTRRRTTLVTNNSRAAARIFVNPHSPIFFFKDEGVNILNFVSNTLDPSERAMHADCAYPASTLCTNPSKSFSYRATVTATVVFVLVEYMRMAYLTTQSCNAWNVSILTKDPKTRVAYRDTGEEVLVTRARSSERRV